MIRLFILKPDCAPLFEGNDPEGHPDWGELIAVTGLNSGANGERRPISDCRAPP